MTKEDWILEITIYTSEIFFALRKSCIVSQVCETKKAVNFLIDGFLIQIIFTLRDSGKTRTCNLLIRSQMLYPLSYGAIAKAMQI